MLAEFPLISDNPILVFVDGMIIACAALQSCWEYNAKDDSWSEIAEAPFSPTYQTGAVVFQEKVYVIDESTPQVFDSSSKTWSSWPSPPNKSGYGPSMAGWKDCIILLGGDTNYDGIQIFNITEQTWTVMDSSQVSMILIWSSSLTLSNEKVLIVGSDSGPHYNSAAFYNPTDNSWLQLEESTTNHHGSRLAQLGSRIFAIDGSETDLVEEFLLETNTWQTVDVELLVKRDGHHTVLALPANLFSHLPGGCQGVV
jgi:N-acetylneuraminic acid mutarotase